LPWPDAAGGNLLSRDLDAHKGIDACVSLCMTRDHPLLHRAKEEGRLPDPRCLAITPDVLQRDGVRIALGVANANEVAILPLGEALALGKGDAEVLYKRTDWTDAAVRHRRQAVRRWEVLVPECVPRDRVARGM